MELFHKAQQFRYFCQFDYCRVISENYSVNFDVKLQVNLFQVIFELKIKVINWQILYTEA